MAAVNAKSLAMTDLLQSVLRFLSRAFVAAYDGTAGLMLDLGSAFVSSWSKYVFSVVAILLAAIAFVYIDGALEI